MDGSFKRKVEKYCKSLEGKSWAEKDEILRKQLKISSRPENNIVDGLAKAGLLDFEKMYFSPKITYTVKSKPSYSNYSARSFFIETMNIGDETHLQISYHLPDGTQKQISYHLPDGTQQQISYHLPDGTQKQTSHDAKNVTQKQTSHERSVATDGNLFLLAS